VEQPPATLGSLLREHRRRAGVRQQDLARRAGLSIRAVRDIEQDRVRHPQPQSIQRLLGALRLGEIDRRRMLATVGLTSAATDQGRLRISVLGPLSVHRGEIPVGVSQGMLRALLGLLALQPGRVVPREELIDALWGEAPPNTCMALVHTYVARLRELLESGRPRRAPGQVLVRMPGGYQLEVRADQLDVLRFEQLADRGQRARTASDPATACALLAEALTRWRGPVLADLGPRLRQHPAAIALGQRRLAATLAHADLAVELGRAEDAVAWLGALGYEEPLHEGLHARLMLALAACGQQAAALRLFVDLRGRLADELGVEPGAELQEAHLRVLRQQLPTAAVSGAGPGDDPSTGTPATTAQAPGRPAKPAQLPADVAAFTGRTEKLEQLDRLVMAGMGTAAVVVSAIAGTAGVGKTALAVHWAHRVRERFPDGQLFTNLRGVQAQPSDPSDVLASFLRALGVDGSTIPVAREDRERLYRTRLADRRVLVLLDDAANEAQVRPLLPGGPSSAVLVTSRPPLMGLEGARLVSLDVFEQGEAVQLLERLIGLERIEAEREAARTITERCGRLPLAVRIAGARLAAKPHWSLRDLAERLGDERRRLAELHAGDLDVRASLDLSYRACRPAQRCAFRLLGLIEGPDVAPWAAATLLGLEEAAASALLEELVDAGLLGVTRRDALGQLRYRFHDVVRLFARERLSEEEPVAARRAALERLLAAAAALARRSDRSLRAGPTPPPADPGPVGAAPVASLAAARPLDWFDAERANLVAAAGQAARDGHTDYAVALALSLASFLEIRQHLADWERITTPALQAATRAGDRHAEASLLLLLGKLRCQQGRLEEALACQARCLPMARKLGDRRVQAEALQIAAMIHRLQGRPGEAVAAARRSRHLLRLLGDRHTDSAVLMELAEVHRLQGQHGEAVACLRRASAVFAELGDRVWTARAWLGLANALRAQDQYGEALELLSSAQAAFRDAGDRRGEAHALRGVAELLRQQGDQRAAIAQYREGLEIFAELGDEAGAARAQYGLGEALRQAGEIAEAIGWFQRCLPVFERLDYPHWCARILHAYGAALAARGDRAGAVARWREALELFQALGMPEAGGVRAQLERAVAR
jgi:DNA-binding SARP family transcriptional activator/tetratricopeptide (TPR) repeat protein